MALKSNVIGLDIGSSSIKLVYLKESKKNIQLLNFGIAPLPSETIVEGGVLNSSALVETLKYLMAQQKLKVKDVAISVSGNSIIVKKVALPLEEEKNLESKSIGVEQYIPFDINDVFIDLQILRKNKEEGKMDVLLVAVKKDLINDYTSAVMEVGLNPVVVDVDFFAVQNMFERNYGIPPKEKIVLIDIGASSIKLNIISDGVTSFTRDISMGGNQITEEIQKYFGVNFDDADAFKKNERAPGSDKSFTANDIQQIIQSISDTITLEIKKTIDFSAQSVAKGAFSKLYLCGGSSKITYLAKAIQSQTNIMVELINPFRQISFDIKKFNVDYLKSIASFASVAIGLALRKKNE